MWRPAGSPDWTLKPEPESRASVEPHMANGASAVVAPVHRIDFMDEAGPGEMS